MATLLRKAIQSLGNSVMKASRGSLSSYVINAPHEWGQPLPQSAAADASGLITPERMREIAMKVPTVAASLNAILDFSGTVPLVVRSIDKAKKVPTSQFKHINEFLLRPNPNDTGLQFFKMLRRDLTTMGFAAIEIERDRTGRPANLWVLDAAKLRMDFDEHGTLLGYDMWNQAGVPIVGKDGVHAFRPEDVIFFRLDPVSSSLYPTSRLTQLFTAAAIEDLMLHFISLRFTDSNIPFGVMDLGDISEDELRMAINTWNSQALKQHRIMLTGSKGSKWFPFGYHLKDLEAVQLLAEVRRKIMGVLGVTMNEIGESQDINKSNGYNLSYTFKKRAIEPLLMEICATITRRLLWDELGYKDVELGFEEIDSRDELLQAEIDKSYQQLGTYTVNYIRNRKGLESVEDGDIPMIFTGSAWLPVNTLDRFAMAQLEALEAVVTAEQGSSDGVDGGGGNVSLPLTRPPAPPEKFTTPDGSGSSTAKILYPSKPKNEPPGNQQLPRGNQQTLQHTGLRKDKM